MADVRIDLDADVGEDLRAADAAIIPMITSADIACGGHAGDERTMRVTVALAMAHDVGIEAHPGTRCQRWCPKWAGHRSVSCGLTTPRGSSRSGPTLHGHARSRGRSGWLL